MESKKSPKADVSRNGSIYFAVGLALMLFLTYTTINYKTYDKSLIDIGQLDLEADLDEEIPLIDQIKPPPPPPPPAAPEVIDIVEDEEEIEETVIESTETDQDEEIEVEDIVVEEFYEDVEVPFSVIENVPEYPGCEKGSNAEKRKCMSAKIAKFVQRKFNTDLAGDLGLSGRQRINVIFKIRQRIINIIPPQVVDYLSIIYIINYNINVFINMSTYNTLVVIDTPTYSITSVDIYINFI